MSVPQRPKWWQEEIIEDQPTADEKPEILVPNGPDLIIKIKEFADAFVQQLKNPEVGVTYKVEVHGSLDVDGTFWACPLSSGFIQEKLEPLSKQLRSLVEEGSASQYEDDHYDKLLCAQSGQNSLWMRAIFIKEVNNATVKLRLIDVGRIEDHRKATVWQVPEVLESIPYMAFYCTLFEEAVKISYNEKFRFNDLVRKQILNFTCKGIKNVNSMNVLYGEMETIIDKPAVNINEEMRKCQMSGEEKPKKKIKGDVRVTISNNGDDDDNNRIVTSDSDTDKLNDLLAVCPKEGTTYKIEVTSPLRTDGTFWACPITSGFIRDKLEPLSDMLKTSILADPDLRKVHDSNGLLCVKSKENHLLTRCIIIKEVTDGRVKIQLIDMGRIEDHPRSKLFRVPESLAGIPYMAFHCSLFEQKVNLSYQERWKFADLCKRKILDFTFLKAIVREQKQLRVGKLENTTEDPVINIIDEIKLAMLSDL